MGKTRSIRVNREAIRAALDLADAWSGTLQTREINNNIVKEK
jgi:hypothetical protein